jgi:ureidoglycolate hydrolase
MQANTDASRVVEEWLLPITPLSAEAFGPFGQLIEAAEDGVSFGDADAQLKLDAGKPRLYIMKLNGRGLAFTQITRLRQVTQRLASVGGAPWFIALAPPGNLQNEAAKPRLEDNRAFRVPGDMAIKLDEGTWHAGPFFEQFPFIILQSGNGGHQSCRPPILSAGPRVWNRAQVFALN